MAQDNKKDWDFGLGSFHLPTPQFASAIFYVYFGVSKAVIGWLAYTHLFPQNVIYEAGGCIMLLIDPIMLVLSKLFGCKPEENNG